MCTAALLSRAVSVVIEEDIKVPSAALLSGQVLSYKHESLRLDCKDLKRGIILLLLLLFFCAEVFYCGGR